MLLHECSYQGWEVISVISCVSVTATKIIALTTSITREKCTVTAPALPSPPALPPPASSPLLGLPAAATPQLSAPGTSIFHCFKLSLWASIKLPSSHSSCTAGSVISSGLEQKWTINSQSMSLFPWLSPHEQIWGCEEIFCFAHSQEWEKQTAAKEWTDRKLQWGKWTPLLKGTLRASWCTGSWYGLNKAVNVYCISFRDPCWLFLQPCPH